jgi:hypothetical protein
MNTNLKGGVHSGRFKFNLKLTLQVIVIRSTSGHSRCQARRLGGWELSEPEEAAHSSCPKQHEAAVDY